MIRDSDITGFLQCLVWRLIHASSPQTLCSESCHANTVHLTRMLVFRNRESKRADGLRAPYNGKRVGFSFRAVKYCCIKLCGRRRRRCCSLVPTLSSSSFLSPTTSVVTHRLHSAQVLPPSSSPTYHTRPLHRVFPIPPPSRPFSFSNRPTIGIHGLAAK